MVDRFAYPFQEQGSASGVRKFHVFTKKNDPTGLNLNGVRFSEMTAELILDSLNEIISSDGFERDYVEKFAGMALPKSPDAGRPKLMGILNATPDSFYPGSRIMADEKLLEKMIQSAPDIIDVGGESTRPGSPAISVEEELSRVSDAVKYITSVCDIPVSIDTRHPETARKMADLGVSYINDISGFANGEMRKIAAEYDTNCVIMHMKSTPADMNLHVQYDNVIAEIVLFFYDRLLEMQESGIRADRVILDPGIGFAKNINGNLKILREITSLHIGFPLLVGTSRKSWIGGITGLPVEDRLPGTIASSIYLQSKGVEFLRVHDVSENRSALEVYSQLLSPI